MQKSFTLAEKKFKYLRNLPKYQWTIVNNKDEFKIYTHNVGPTKTIKIVKEFSTEINLDHYFASLSTLEVRTQWCCLFKNVTLFSQVNTNTSIIHATTIQDENIQLVEQTLKKKHHVQYISTSIIDEQEYFMCILIENRFDHARATIYYHQDKVMAVKLISNLLSLKPFPYISQCDKAIQLQQLNYKEKVFDLTYLFTEQNYNCQELPRDILDHHQSWDNHQTQRKNKFLSSSSLLFSSSPNLNTKIMSSYPEKHSFLPSSSDDDDDDEDTSTSLTDELRIELDHIPQLSISLPDNANWSNKFAQLCVRCYKKPNKFILQILHPYNLMQYFNDDMKLDDGENSIQVHLVLKVSQHQKFIVNDNEWPIRTWRSQHEDTSCSASEQDDDIFVDGMENIMDHVPSEQIIDTLPIPSPHQQRLSQVQPVQLLQPQVQQQVQPQVQPQQQQTEVQVPTKIVKDKLEIFSENKPVTIETTIPASDPVALQKVYTQFSQCLRPPYDPVLVQAPSKENGHVAIKKLEIPNHAMGGFLSESVWTDCSVWDIKAVLESAGARKIWDNTFESTTFLHALTQTSSIWHTKLKGAWPVNPRDYVCFHGQYTSPHRIDLLSTSCIGDSFQYKPLPKETSGYIRATMDVMGWRLQRTESHTVSVKQVLVTQFPTWVINFITSRFLVQTCAAVQSAKEYFENFGAPPSLESLSWALLVNLKHDHEKKNWRCEYTRRADAEKDERKAVEVTVEPPKTVSVIRLDKRRWAQLARNRYSIVIDPPPSRVTAVAKACDPFGVWVSIEHAEEFIIPLRGKILVLIKPDQLFDAADDTCHLNVNGVTTPIEQETEAVIEPVMDVPEPELKLEPVPRQITEKTVVLTEQEQANQALDALTVTPKEQAQAAFTFLKQTDEQFGWTMITENNKSGLKVFKKSGLKPNAVVESDTLVVPEPYMIYKATKVIENFSLDEVTCVVTDIGSVRKTYDDTIEQIDLVRQVEPGCRVVQQTVKALFPFKNREVYATSCLAQEIPSLVSSNKRTMYIESSLPDFPVVNSKKTRGILYMSGWILEPIDPYTTTTNHPIPSTRVTYVTALDLGTSIPSYISNLVANNWASKKIQYIESYLKSKGSPPFVSQPQSALVFASNTLSVEEQDDLKWVTVQSSYDKEKHQYKVTNRVRISKRHIPVTEHIPLTTSTSASTSSSSSVAPLRRPSIHTIVSSDLGSRRGSLPVNALTKKRISPAFSSDSKPLPLRSITMLQATFDLRAYTKGYEVQAQLFDISDPIKKRNVSSKLVLSISEPLLSHLIDDDKKKSIKHTILVQANIMTPVSSVSVYELEFSVTPVREETAQSKAAKLTVSHVLGEDKQQKYDGIILVNGEEAEVGSEMALKSLQDEADTESMHEDKAQVTTVHEELGHEGIDASEYTSEETVDYMGGGVVAAALGNVSAGVNQLGARMMNPFRSSSFLTSANDTEDRNKIEDHSNDIHSSADEDEYHSRYFSREEKYKINTSSTLHEIRLLRRSSDTMRKGMLLLFICISLGVVIALLMVQPMVERYYASFNAASTVSSLDRSMELGLVHRLIQIPWFGGWDIQVIAIKRQNA